MKTLRPGDVGDVVRTLQSLLNTRLDAKPLHVHGIYDETTEQAVIAHQSRSIGPDGQPLVVDAVVGPLTWWSLLTDDQSSVHAPQNVRIGEPRSEFARVTIEVALEEMRAGARETGENNRGPFIRKYLEPAGREHGAWCAGFTSWCVHEASRRRGVEPPFKYTGVARNILTQLTEDGLAVSEPQPGDVVVWWRVAPDSWQGHVEIVTAVEAGVMWTIAGNRGAFPAPVRQYSYVIERERKLLGFARLTDCSGVPEPTQER